MSPGDIGSGYSAKVTIRLRVNGCMIPVGQVGEDRLIFDEPIALPEGDAEVIVTVDGRESRYPVLIHDRAIARCVVPIVIQAST